MNDNKKSIMKLFEMIYLTILFKNILLAALDLKLELNLS